MTYASELALLNAQEAAQRAATEYQPILPFDLVEATEHHGPYITTAFGTSVCDFYAMTQPGIFNDWKTKPVLFADAVENAAFMVRAANAHDELISGLRHILQRAQDRSDRLWCRVDDIVEEAQSLLAKHGGAA